VLSARECNGHSFYIDDIDNIVVEGEYYNSSAASCQAWQVAHEEVRRYEPVYAS